MTNLSQIRRDRMKEFLETLKEKNNSDEQIKAINEIENFLDEKRYGLVWEEHEEEVDVKMQDSIPVFTEDVSRKIISDPDKPMNFLLEGDNLHSLYLLKKTHKNLIDVIYIDPSYNTKNKEFKYDDTFVDDTDGFKHSKWLSFMSRRLEVARDLLAPDGMIFVSIDYNEQAALQTLMNSLFGEDRYIGTFLWNKTSTAPSLSKTIRHKYEYVLAYKKANLSIQLYGGETEGGDVPLLNGSNNVSQLNVPKSSIEFRIPDGLYAKGQYDGIELLEDINVKDGQADLDVVKMKGQFKWQQSMLDQEIEKETFLLIKSKKMSVRFQRMNKSVKVPSDIISKTEVGVGTNEEAKKEIENLVPGVKFDYPKPVSLIKYLIQMATAFKKDATVLDFFAGSGTTGQAVVELNELDGGNRNFIIATNNENNIAEEVTFERLKNYSKGYDVVNKTKQVLFEENLTFAKLKKVSEVLEKMEKVVADNEGKFDSISKVLDGTRMQVIGEFSKKSTSKGKNINLKYFKTDFIPRTVEEDESLTDELLDHVKEMAELEFGVDLATSPQVKLVMDEDELDEFFTDASNGKLTLLIPTFVLLKGPQELSAEQRNITIIRVPDYYFASELKEAGEL